MKKSIYILFAFLILGFIKEVFSAGNVTFTQGAGGNSVTIAAGSSSGSSVSKFNVTFNAEQAKVPGTNACIIQNSTTTVMPAILCDASTDESVTWAAILSPYTTTQMNADIYYTMVSTHSGAVVHNVSVMCASTTYNSTIDVESFGSVNASTVTVPSLIGRMGFITIPLVASDDCKVNDIFIVKYNRDANAAADTATGDIALRKMRIYEP